MSLLSKHYEGPAAYSDEALLLHGMLCVAGADGTFDSAEVTLVESYFAQLPEFAGKDLDQLMAQAREIVALYPSTLHSLEALAELSSAALKRKLFLVAVDIALASGALVPREDLMLEALQRVLEIDDATASKLAEVMAIKYAR
jgi:hypothetical protein